MLFQIGAFLAEQLLSIHDRYSPVLERVLVTLLLDVLQIPNTLSSLTVDYNYIGNLTIVGYIFCRIVILLFHLYSCMDMVLSK